MPKYTEQQLQNAINHARREPTIPRKRIAALYQVNVTTLNRRIAGTQVSRSIAHRDEQLFAPGEEKAIAEHCGTMADLGFPVSHDLLKRIAQDMLNSRKQPPKMQGGIIAGIANGRQRILRANCQGVSSEIHQIGTEWVSRFLARNSDFRTKYVRYQERARKAASDDRETQAYFLRILANLIRRHSVKPENIWNCDEKGIIMGRNEVRTAAIVRRSTAKEATMMTEGSREYASVLETVNAAGKVIPPFIVWQAKTHRESYYDRDDTRDASFAVSASGYMDDELGRY